MGNVTSYERRLAHQRANSLTKFERAGVYALSRAALSAMRAVRRAYMRGQLTNGIVSSHISAVENELVDAYTVAYLTGLKQSMQAMELSLSATSKQVDMLRRFLKLTPAQVEKIRGKRQAELHQELMKVAGTTEQKVQKALLKSIEMNEHVDDAVDRLEKAFQEAGITPKSSFKLEGIFRTHMQIAYAGARWKTNQQPLINDVLWGYKYVTVGDDRVRPTHVPLDGVTLPKDHPFWITSFPPNGWACRCQAIEMFKPMKEVYPPETAKVDGIEVAPGPDKGFNFNPALLVESVEGL